MFLKSLHLMHAVPQLFMCKAPLLKLSEGLFLVLLEYLQLQRTQDSIKTIEAKKMENNTFLCEQTKKTNTI
jgi:hypothetical protein